MTAHETSRQLKAGARGRRRLAALTAVTGMALLLGACSSAGAGAGSGSSGGSSGKGPITLGEMGPLTGPRADIGAAMVEGAKLALSVVNADGGVLGHQVKLDPQDDASDPADAVPAADKEINVDHVVAIVGPIVQTAPVVLPLAAKAGIPMLMWGGGAVFDYETSPYFFRLAPSDTEMSDAMMVYAHERGWNKVALAIGNTTGDTSLIPGLDAAAKKLGMTIQRTVTIAVGSTSFRSEITDLFAGHPQAIVGQFDIPSAGVLFGELKQENLLATPWVVSNLWFAKEFFTSVGASVATGPIYIANPGTENGGYKPFLALLQQKTGQSQPSNGETYMYDAVNIWALGAQEAGTYKYPALEQGILKAADGPGTTCTSYTQCFDLLKAGKPIKYVGAASSVTFDKYHNVYGPFDVLHYNSDGSVSAIATMTPEQITGALGK
jgi:ABC-type branched-subunit amino acid transport system substrate-binding protein